MDGQAGLLAGKLEQELAEKEEAACPVCKTLFRGAHNGCFARAEKEIPAKEAVDEARKVFEVKDAKRQRQSQTVAGRETEIREKKAAVVSRLQEMEPTCRDWETVCADGWLEELETRYRQQEEKAAQALHTAEDRSRRLACLRKQMSEKEEEAASCSLVFEESRESEQEHRQTCEKLQAAAEELIRALAYYEACPDQKSAIKRRRSGNRKRNDCCRSWSGLRETAKRPGGSAKRREAPGTRAVTIFRDWNVKDRAHRRSWKQACGRMDLPMRRNWRRHCRPQGTVTRP